MLPYQHVQEIVLEYQARMAAQGRSFGFLSK